jgi:hypothetical protein
MVELFLLKGADWRTDDYQPIQQAAKIGNYKTVKLLFQKGIYPDFILKHILNIGVEYNNPKIILLLLGY